MKPQIITVQEVRSYFNDLIPTLHKNDYFGFEDGARKYVKDLFNDIKQNLPNKLRKPSPKHFEKYGKNIYYASFKKSKHTTWYVFFTIHYDEINDIQIFLIRYISNNHMISKYL